MKRVLFLLAFICMGIGTIAAQSAKVTGKVTDSNGEAVFGASVFVVGTNRGANTDVEGNFTIENVPSSATTLRVSYVGMTTQEVHILRGKPMKIQLVEDGVSLDELMVVAFGTAKKSAFTGSAKVVDAEVLENTQVTSVTNALSGKVAGVQLTSSNGAPGAQASIKIRGISSINADNDPLIIVDGAPYSGDLNNLNPNDVESMTVLKDAASNALYGARGANGVIIITTKNATKKGEATVTFDAKWGANTNALRKYEVITNPAQYYETHYSALYNRYINDGLSANAAWIKANENLCGIQGNGGLGYNVYTVPEGEYMIGMNGKLNPNATLGRVEGDYYMTPDDWEDVGTRTGLRQEYNASVSAANERSSFYASIGYLENEGITYGSDMERLTARLKADYQAKKWLKVGGNLSYTNFEFNSLSNNGASNSSGNVWAFTSQMAPIYPVYVRNADGSIKYDSNGLAVMDYGNGMNGGHTRPFISDANPLMDNKLNTNQSEGNALTAHGFANITIINGLTLSVNATANLDETRSTHVYNPYYGQFDTTGGTVSKEHTRSFNWNTQQMLNYAFTLGKNNNFDITLGHEYYRSEAKLLYADKSKMFSQDNKELGGAVLDGQSAYSYADAYNNEGYIARLQYNYGERIFGSVSFRRDASSRFHPDYRWGNFWSVGAAWLINKESWFKAKWVDELKIKASIGEMGNDRIGSYRYTDLYNIVNSAGNIGTSFKAKGTPDISWEKNTNFNVGAEFALFKRVTGSIEYFNRKTTDMLFSFSVAPSLGYSSFYDNVGDMTNQGVELEMNVNIFNKKNLNWDVYFNISTIDNNIDMIHPDKKTSSLFTFDGQEFKGYNYGSFFISEDLSMYTWRLKKYAGVDENTGKALYYKRTEQPKLNADGTPVLDEKQNPVTEFVNTTTDDWSAADYYILDGETTIADFMGGFGTSFAAYGFDFSINCSFQIGGKQLDDTYSQFMSSPTTQLGYNYHADLLNSWTPENKTNIPRFCYGDLYSAASSDRFLTDASFLNIDNINVGYTLPKQFTKKFGVNSLRLYVSADNVFYWSKRQGFDPRQSLDSSTNAANYSPMRTVSGGVTIKF